MSRLYRNESGHAVLVVSFVGLLASLAGIGFFGTSVIAEQRQIARSLAETRAYWAAMGEFSYQASRLRAEGGCACDYDTKSCKGKIPLCDSDLDRQYTLSTIIGELGATRRWSYASDGADYYIDLSMATEPDSDGKTSTDNGHLRTSLSFDTKGASAHPALAGLTARLRPIELRFCTGLADKALPCHLESEPPADAASGLLRIKSIRRPAP